ncbi:hypothetical protein J4731_18155 [Providencia rettgeri]|nr:hypothetical protein [Providencia rettgeri]
MILSVSMPLIFWTKMNDIRLRPLAIFFGWTPAKKPFTQARQTHCVRLTTPFSPLYLVAQKCGGQTLRLTGLCPKRNTFTGVHLPSLGRVISFRLPLFSLSSLDAHQDKNKKPTALVLLGWSNRFLPQNKFVTFSDFASFTCQFARC